MRLRSLLPAAAVAGLALSLASAASAQDAPAGEEEMLRPGDITADHVGESLVVHGRVAKIERRPDGVLIYFLGADVAYPFQVLLPVASLHNWAGTDPVKRYSPGRNLKISGEIEEHADRPMILATDRDQIEVIPRRRRRR